MDETLSQISLYLAKDNETFETVRNLAKDSERSTEIHKFPFTHESPNHGNIDAILIYTKKVSKKDVPPWLEFIKPKIPDSSHADFQFLADIETPSGALLLKYDDKIAAATFGTAGKSLINLDNFEPHFGLRTAMNMCNPEELRQVKSKILALNTQYINRQTSEPSELFDFNMSKTEAINYISAHLNKNKEITIQGKDNLTIKVLKNEKITWEKLIDHVKIAIHKHGQEIDTKLFPNFILLESVSKKTASDLDAIMLEKIKNNDENIHLAIPDFLADDEYSFSYKETDGLIFNFIDINQLIGQIFPNTKEVNLNKLKSQKVFAIHVNDANSQMPKSWSIYKCLICETEYDGSYYILSEGNWTTITKDSHKEICAFRDNLTEIEFPQEIPPINIFDGKNENREAIFNEKYCDLRKGAILFDKAKLKMGDSNRVFEFCDILELDSKTEKINIIQVKKFSGGSSISYLLHQAQSYCSWFATDDIFLTEIHKHICKSTNEHKEKFYNKIKTNNHDFNGRNFNIQLWFLYDKKKMKNKDSLPLIILHNLMLIWETLKVNHKYNDLSVCFIPVEQTKVQKDSKPRGKKKN